MPSHVFRLSWKANADLQAIADFLGERSPAAAANVLGALRSAFELLAEHPLLGEPRDDFHPGIRMFVPDSPADSYVVFYYPQPNGIEISDCIHAARDWVGMFVRGER